MSEVKYITLILAFCCFAQAEVMIADINQDGVDDEIIVGENSVVVVDGKSGDRTVVHKVTDTEYEINSISNCKPIHLGEKIGLLIDVYSYGEGAAHGNYYSIVYLYKNNQYVKINIQGPQIAELDFILPNVGRIYCDYYQTGVIDIEGFSWWDGQKFRRMKEKYTKFEDELTITAGAIKRIPFVVLDGEMLYLDGGLISGGGSVTASGYDIRITVETSDGLRYFDTRLSEGYSLSETEFIQLVPGSQSGGEPRTVYLVFDNSDAIISWRKVNYFGTVYSSK